MPWVFATAAAMHDFGDLGWVQSLAEHPLHVVLIACVRTTPPLFALAGLLAVSLQPLACSRSTRSCGFEAQGANAGDQ